MSSCLLRFWVALALQTAVWSVVRAASPSTAADPWDLVPMTVGVALSQDSAQPGATITVLGTVRLLAGWHTYAHVPPGKPYIQTKWSIDPSTGVTAEGDWIIPVAVPDPRDVDLTIYEGDSLSFTHSLKVNPDASGEQSVRVGIVFQTCNLERCLPPTRQSFDLKLAVGASQSN